MRRYTQLSSLLAFVFIIAGCTTSLKVDRLKYEDASKNALVGPVYYLPVGKYDISVTRQLKKCEYNEQDKQFDIVFSVVADVKPSFAPDLSNPYQIDYQKLNGVFKKVILDLELYDNGTIKNINGDISDRTAAVVQNTIKGGVQFARMAIGVPSVPKMFGMPEYGDLCNYQTKSAIRNFDNLTKDIEILETNLPSYGPDTRPQYETDLKRKKVELAKYAGHLSHTKTYMMTPQFTEAGTWAKALNVPASVFMKWFYYPKNAVHKSFVEPMFQLQENAKSLENQQYRLLVEASKETNSLRKNELKQQAQKKGEELEGVLNYFNNVAENKELDSQIRLVSEQLNTVAKIDLEVGKTELAKSSKTTAEASSRLIYRQPGPVVLYVCKFSSCEEGGNIIHQEEYNLPQAGIYTTLPVENGVFDKNNLTVKFGPAGNLETFKYIKDSQAEAASVTFSDIAGATGQIVDAKRGKESVELQNKLDILNLKNKILEAQATNDDLTGK